MLSVHLTNAMDKFFGIEVFLNLDLSGVLKTNLGQMPFSGSPTVIVLALNKVI